MPSQDMDRMLEDIGRETALTAPITGIRQLDPGVMQAMARVPREQFVPQELHASAYDNRPLPIGHEQTISQPFIVALMTHLLKPAPQHRVLEIGTGSGYQTAVLSQLVGKVYSIDRIPALVERAEEVLAQLGFGNIETGAGNGYRGWAEHAPYDGVIVTAAANQVPSALVEQLGPSARLVIPVGPPFGRQELMLIEKDPAGELHSASILPVAFVPLQDDSPPDKY